MLETLGYLWLDIWNLIVKGIYAFFALCGVYLFLAAVYDWFKTKKYLKAITILAIPVLLIGFWIWNSLYTLLAIIALTILALLAWLTYYLVTKDWGQWWSERCCDHDMKTRLRDCGFYTQCTKCGYGYYRDYGK